MKKLELLAPAGNLSKLKVALNYGADACYVGGKDFSLRSYADNFTYEELAEGVEYAHKLGKKVYVTANIFAKNADFEQVKEYFKYLESIAVDAVLITDAGLMALAKEVAPGLPRHLSTQANTLNKYTVKFWAEQGVERVVLARELSLQDVKEIHDFNKDTELEAFVHGAMCISYSGRCLLSNYLTSRDANRGECVQACRWNYEIKEISKYPRPPLEVQEDERGTYFMNSKDLNMLSYIAELAESGIVSFKIEGRMKSEYYLATVISAYRKAIDEYYEHGAVVSCEELQKELLKIAHRDYTTAYAFCNNEKTVSYNDDQHNGSHDFIASVKSAKAGEAVVEMRNRFYSGDTLEILSPTTNHNKTFEITTIINSRQESITDAKRVQELLPLTLPDDITLSAGDMLRRKK
ncbi:MAG: U32 family peptidase [Bacillota bacterium]